MINIKLQLLFQSNMTSSIQHRLNIYKTCKHFRTSNSSIEFKVNKYIIIKDIKRMVDHLILSMNKISYKIKISKDLRESQDTRENWWKNTRIESIDKQFSHPTKKWNKLRNQVITKEICRLNLAMITRIKWPGKGNIISSHMAVPFLQVTTAITRSHSTS